MKWATRFLKLIAVVLLAAVGVAGYSAWKSRKIPEWYKPFALSAEQVEALAHRAENQIARVNNMAGRAHALESAARQGATAPTTVPSEQLRFREDELNALFLKWTAPDRDRIDKYLADPQIHLQDGTIIVAGTMKDLDKVISIHLEPSIDSEGRLDLGLSAVYTGQLLIPSWALSQQIDKVDAALEQYLPIWQQDAALSPHGGSNEASVDATLAKLALDALHHELSPPYFFLRYVDPVRLTDVQVTDGEITLTVQPLDEAERNEALRDIKQPWSPVKAAP